MIRRAGVLLSTTVGAGVLLLATALPAAAVPTKTAPPSGDDRATSHVDNATTCSAAHLDGTVVKLASQYNQDKTTVTVTSVPSDLELTGIVVKGGDGYNVYPPNVLTDLHSPLVGKPGNVPTISHWFACGVKKTTTSSSSSQPSSPAQAPGGSPSKSATTTTTTPAAQGSVGGTELANTGFSATAPLIGGGALLLLGGGLLLALRRFRRS
jgi:LPXTG-motif cell wall-anchored protein